MTNKKPRCLLCDSILSKCLCVVGSDKSSSGNTEKLYHCTYCRSYIEVSETRDGQILEVKRWGVE